MTPDVFDSWATVLTQDRGLIISAIVVLMFAGIGIALILGLVLAWRFGVFSWIKKQTIQLARQNDATEIMIQICRKAGYGVEDNADSDHHPGH